MGFNSVYQILMELFPQVDARLLKAVAIEHAKDPDGAAESILAKVLLFTSEKKFNVDTPIVRNNGKMTEMPRSSTLESVVGEDANDSPLVNDAHNFDGDSLASFFYDANDTDELQNGNTRNEDLMSFTRCEETIVEASQAENLSVTSGSLINECIKDDCIQGSGDYEGDTFVPSCDYEDKQTDVHVDKTNEASSSTLNTEYPEADVSLINCSDANQDCGKDAPAFDYHQEQKSLDCGLSDRASVSVIEPEAGNEMSFFDGDNEEMSSYVNADFTQDFQDFPVTDDGAEGETSLSTIVTNSGQICRINLVEGIIEDAKNYKDVLLSATESILRLIEDVEHQEKEAEQAKAAAARGGLDILEKVEELKKMLKHAKEANEMHTGEVYGEKSILATEVRELQTRLFGLADEKDKSLAILDEMRVTLGARLAASEEERKAAEKEMHEKQEIAKGALAEQELVMGQVVQESKLLQQEAEENAKLRDFLMEKGGVVDELQGEISVICQDVKSLKENFDKRVSLSKSLSIEHTSFRMASSTSSVKSMTSDPATGHMELPETPKRMNRGSSVDCQTPRSNVGEEENVGSGATPLNELLDEGWELFDF